MNRNAVTGIAIALTFVAAGCGNSPDSPSPAAAPNPTPETTVAVSTTTGPQATASKETPQGWLIKGIGELAALGGTSLESSPIKFTIDRIDVNPKCQQYGTKARPGNKTVVLHVTMTTGDLDQDGLYAAPMIFNPYSIKGVTSAGFTHDATPGSCIDYSTSFPSEVTPHGKYSGTVDVELPVDTVSIVVTNPTMPGGWTWSLAS